MRLLVWSEITLMVENRLSQLVALLVLLVVPRLIVPLILPSLLLAETILLVATLIPLHRLALLFIQ